MRGKKSGVLAVAGAQLEVSEFSKRRMTREERLYAMMLEPAKAVRFESRPNEARWFCLSVAGGADFTVGGKLSTAGVEVFILKRKEILVKAGKSFDIEKPVFAGYIFVRILPTAEAFHAIKQVVDVQNILKDGIRYAEVPSAHMDAFTRVYTKPDPQRMPVDRSISQGCLALITDDLFTGYKCGVVQVFSGRNPRVRVSVMGFGEYAHDVTLPLAYLQKL
jgi:transcriptional antiterminator NusG